MRIGLTQYRGTGTSRDPFIPGCRIGGGWGVFDLRGDCTVPEGYGIVISSDDDLPIHGAYDLGQVDELDSPLPMKVRRFIENRLDVEFPTAYTTRIMLRELMLNLGDRPGKWKRLREGTDGFVRGFINGIQLFAIPVVRGGATFTESFNKVNSTVLGPDLTWTEVLNDAEVFSAKWRNVTGTAGDVTSRAEHDVGSSDMYTQANAEWTSWGNWTICTRFASSAVTYYGNAGNNQAAEGSRLVKVVNNGWSVLTLTSGSSTFTTSENSPYLYRIEANGSTITGKINGATQNTASDTSITTGQRGGLSCYAAATQIRFSSFEAGTIGGGAATNINVPAGSSATAPGRAAVTQVRTSVSLASTAATAYQASISTTGSGGTLFSETWTSDSITDETGGTITDELGNEITDEGASDGAAWNSGRWTNIVAQTGGAVDIRANWGRLNSGTQGSNNGYAHAQTIASFTDFELTLDLCAGSSSRMLMDESGNPLLDENGQPLFDEAATLTDPTGTANGYTVGICFRGANNSMVGSGNTYRLLFTWGATDTVAIQEKTGAGTYANLIAASTYTVVPADLIHVKIRCVSSTIQVRLWKNGEAEPGTWLFNHTDAASPFLSGQIGLMVQGGTDTTADEIYFDNMLVSNTSAGSTMALTLNPQIIQTTFTAPTIVSTLTQSLTLNPINIATTFGAVSASSTAQITTQNAVFTFPSPGTFTVTHTASNAYGTGTVTKQVVVAPPGSPGSAPVANFTYSANPTQNASVQFTDTSTNTPTSWLWNFGDSTPTSTLQNPTHTFTTANTFNVTLTATNATGSNTTSKSVVVISQGGGGAAGSSCTTAPADFTVGVNGTLQQIVDNNPNLAGKTIRIPAGVYNCGSYVLNAVNRNFGGVQIVADPNAILRGDSGIEMYGQILGFTWCGGVIEVNGNNVVGEGVMIDSTRSDKGANGNAGGRITFDNVTIRPQAGTGKIQRNGLAIWGCDLVTVRYCTIHDASGNAAFGFGGAGSGISIGHGRRLSTAGSPRVLIDHNLVYNQIGMDGQESADRNGIILDLFHADSNTPFSDYIIGDVIVSNNEIYDVWGRGIQVLRGGLTDSLVTVSNNYVHGFYADHLGQSIGNTSHPVCGIGGYGAGVCGNVLVNNNRVTPYGGHAAYKFMNFDGAGPGVLGSGNQGLPVVFEASRTNSPPSGFSS